MTKILNNNNYAYISEKLMMEKTSTKLKSSLNSIIKGKENKESIPYIAAYVHYNNFKLFIDEDKHEDLYNEMKKYLEKINAKSNNEYKAVQNELKDYLDKYLLEDDEKKDFIIEVKTFVSNNKISFKKVFERFDIKYSNGYNFFVKEDTKMVSIERVKEFRKEFSKLVKEFK